MGESVLRWLEIGLRNPWIREACDPPFTRKSFHRCATREELRERIWHGNWCLGQAFYLGDLCFIQQVDGGDEWLSGERIAASNGAVHAALLDVVGG